MTISESEYSSSPTEKSTFYEVFLSSLNNSYKIWIDELEKFEDEAQDSMDKKREKSMASLKEELKQFKTIPFVIFIG